MGEKKQGRPRKAPHEKLVSLTTAVRPSDYDVWFRRAKAVGRPISAVVRDALKTDASS